MQREDALRIVYETIDIVNQQLPASRRLPKRPDTVIVGVAGALDSLAIVNFIVTLEEKAGEVLGSPIQLLDDTMLGQADSPFRTVDTLTAYLQADARG